MQSNFVKELKHQNFTFKKKLYWVAQKFITSLERQFMINIYHACSTLIISRKSGRKIFTFTLLTNFPKYRSNYTQIKNTI